MSEKVAHGLGEVVAGNVRRWRVDRGLDQQALADRLADLGWPVDRTTVVRIEQGARRVTVDDLGLLAVALNVPLPLLLLPVHERQNVVLTPAKRTQAVHPWMIWEWMLGNEPLPGRIASFGDEWRSGAIPLWVYERVRVAQLQLRRLDLERVETSGSDYVTALQELVDAVSDMNTVGLPADDLVADGYRQHIEALDLAPSPRGRRYRTVAELDASREEH